MTPLDPIVARYSWAQEDNGPFRGGAVVALVRGLSPGQVLDVLAPDRKTPVQPAQQVRDWALHQTYPRYGTAVEAGVKGGWTLVVEESGYRASQTNLLEVLSRDGEAVALYRSVNADMSFQYAPAGRVVREFDPLLYDTPSFSQPLPEEAGLPFGWPGAPTAAGLALIERLTDVALAADDLGQVADRIAVGIYPD